VEFSRALQSWGSAPGLWETVDRFGGLGLDVERVADTRES